MLAYLTVIFCCQLAGELIVTATGLPIPGPVAGMTILFTGLLIRGVVPENLGKTADALIENLALLFIPAGVGVMLHAQLIGRDWLPLTVALVGSTTLTIAVTARMMVWLSPKTPSLPEEEN